MNMGANVNNPGYALGHIIEPISRAARATWRAIFDPTAAIAEYERRKAQKVAYNQMQAMLLNDPKKLAEARQSFEKSFGVDQQTRTAAQWKRLINVYGMPTVCKQENMPEWEVRSKAYGAPKAVKK